MTDILHNEITKINDFNNSRVNFSDHDNCFMDMYQDMLTKFKFISINIPELIKIDNHEMKKILEFIRIFVFNFISRYRYNYDQNMNIIILVEMLLKFKYEISECFYNKYLNKIDLIKCKRIKNIMKISNNSITKTTYNSYFD